MEGMAANSKADFSPVSDIIRALQDILARPTQVTIPDLETPYFQASSPDANISAIELKDRTVIDVISTERQQQLDVVVHEISGLQTVMDSINNLHQQLSKKKDKITQSMNSHQRLASALWRFPTEVLSYIFMYCLPEDKYLSPMSNLAPALLTRICRRWRDVAVGTPVLWCRLFVDVYDRGWQKTAFGCDSWLKRSQQCPLSLAVKYVGHDTTNQRSLLRPYMSQISSLCICFSSFYPDGPFMLTDFIALQELTIHHSHHDPALVQWISRLPLTLRSLKLLGMWFDIGEPPSSKPVWSHLTNVHIVVYRDSKVLFLLRLCPNLSSLTACVTLGTLQAQMPFTHTKLQYLRIADGNMHAGSFHCLFDVLSLPNLRVLEASEIVPWPHEKFKDFLARSNCPLESLIFGVGVWATDEERAEYSALIPSMEVIVDHKRPNYRDLMLASTPNDGNDDGGL
ncbi:hypothetical protein EV702DRAFT_1001467 [Suillus placidus]|uniref:F-box domain-containing protein n=1 Tax=Suillus placidus TaxID=48579 RepID=A0A9P7A0J8_9AGAM|nr:hypothetical protein EV702DRAFT_1001467 [Suillus placidus]